MQNKKLLYLKDVAAYFGVTPKIVSKWVDDGKLSAVRTPGGHRRVIASDFYAFLEKHNRESKIVTKAPELLIVDDNDSFLELYKLIFRKQKYTITCCSNGKEALALLQKKAYDIVLTDIQMPVMNGRVLLREIRRLHRSTKVLIMSNFDINSDEYHLMGALGSFEKSIGRKDLLHKVATIATEQRVSKRFNMNRQVILDADMICRSINVSCDGVLVAGDSMLQAGSHLMVTVKDQDKKLSVSRKAQVIRSTRHEDTWQSALYFEDSIGHELADAFTDVF